MEPIGLSLKWKALLIPSMVLLVVFVATSTFLQNSLTESFEESRREARLRFANELDRLVADSARRLLELGELLPSMQGVMSALLHNNKAELQAAFEHHRPTLQVSQGINGVSFYSKDNALLGRWGDPLAQEAPSQESQEWLDRANKEERPLAFIHCTPSCIHRVVTPVMDEGRHLGVLVLERSLADSLFSSAQTRGKDIGVLVHTGEPEPEQSADHTSYLQAWGLRVVALSNQRAKLGVLMQAAAQFPKEALGNGQSMRLVEGGRHYELNLFPLEQHKASTQRFLVMLDDITDSIKAMDNAIHTMNLIQMGGFLLAELFLLMILLGPTSRLRRLARLLPLLIDHKHQRVRDLLLLTQTKRYLFDEIDVLEEAAVNVSRELDIMAEEVRQNTRELTSHLAQLKKEQAFAERMLDKARVVVLTQDEEGKIVSVNRYGEEVAEQELPELVGKDMTQILSRVMFT